MHQAEYISCVYRGLNKTMHHPANPTRIKTARVFVSSTFSDMHAERDYLNRFVFPELRSRCIRQGVEFVGIDLRWGVTEKEIEQRGALSACLDDIKRCNIFLSLLGDRYGWIPVPEEIPQEFFEAVRHSGDLTVDDAGLLDEWYLLDRMTDPPVYRLRRDHEISDDDSVKLIDLCEEAGLPHAGDSIVAQEIRGGVFEPSRHDPRAFFYLRSSGLHKHPDFPESMVPVFVEQDPDHQEKLACLKERIQSLADEKIKIKEYDGTYAGIRIDPTFLPPMIEAEAREALRDGVIHPEDLHVLSDAVQVAVNDHGTIALAGMEALGQQITEDLWAAIEAELKESDEPSDTAPHERPYHERFLTERTRLFLGRGDLLGSMLGYATDTEDQQPLVITGKTGCGKSSLLAECARLCRKQNHHALVLPHFIGAAPDSTNLHSTIRSLCETLRSECNLYYEISHNPEKLHHQLPVFLEKAGAKCPVILLIDAVNQLNPANRSHELGWLPFHLPPGVRVIVSTLSGDCLDRLQERVSTDHILQVHALPKSDRENLIRMHLANRGKKLTEKQLASLLDTSTRPDAGLPLYLLVALEELCLFGEYESLDLRIDTLPATLPDLFDQVLMRLEQDHTRDRAESILRLFAVSRSGLLESEILDLLGGGAGELSRIHWTQFYRSLEPYLRPVDEATGMGLIDFFHDQLRFAVYHRYLNMASPDAGSSEDYCKSHSQLADYFRGVAYEGDPAVWRNDQPRGLAELPYHLAEAGRKNELRGVLFDFGWLQANLDGIDVNSLIVDYDYLSDDSDIRLVQGAIRMSAQVLARDKTQLAGQLFGRMQSFQESGIQSMLEQAREWEGDLWLRPLTTSLTPPGGPLVRIQGGHTSSVLAVAVMPDGKRAISASSDNTLRVWDIESGKKLQTLKGHTDAVDAVAVTPDGKRAISGSWDDTLKVWDIESGEEIQTLKGHTEWVYAVIHLMKVLKGNTIFVSAVAVTPDGKHAISASRDKTLVVWDIESGEEIQTLKGHTEWVQAVAVTPDGKHAISGSSEKTLRVWDIESGEEIQTLKGHTDGVYAVAVMPDGKHAITGSDDDTLRVWNIESGEEIQTLESHTDGVYAVAVTPDGKHAITGSDENTLRVWDIESGEEIQTLTDHTDAVDAVAVTPDGKHAISASRDKTLMVWDIESGKKLRTLKGHADAVDAVAVTPDGKHAISGSGDNTFKVWDIESGEEIQTFKGHTSWVYAVIPILKVLKDYLRSVDVVAVTPDGKHAISGSSDNTLRVWDIKSGNKLRRLKGHTGVVSAVAVTPDGKHTISASRDKTLRVWDIESGKKLRTLKGHANAVDAVAVTPDGKHAISGSDDDTLRVWDIESGKKLRTLKGHADFVSAVAVTPDGKHAISASRDKTLRVWDIESGKKLWTLEGHTDKVVAVAVTPDGKHAISGSDDNTLRVWDIESGQTIASFSVDGSLHACAISPDGKTIVAGDASGRVHFLRLQGVE
jgi:WD40 repeat protein/energy-coupling factor transporter ATP-binding protein EcfA2